MSEVRTDEAVAFARIPVRGGTRRPRCLPRPPGRSAGAPCLWCLGNSQGPITQAEKSRCRGREQERADDRRHQAGNTDRRQEPEAEHAEQCDEPSDDEGQYPPGAQVAVPVEVQRDLTGGEDGEEQARPYQRGVLAGVEGLSGVVAGHAVHSRGNQGKGHLSWQWCPPARALGLDGAMGDSRAVSSRLREFGHPGAAGRDVGGLAGPQTLILHSFIGGIDVADQDRRVYGGQEHCDLQSVTDCYDTNT